MKRVLIGPIIDGKAGGIDRYILNLFHELNHQNAEFDFFTNRISEPLQKELKKNDADLFQTSGFSNPFGQYRDFKRILSQKKYDTVYFNLSTALGFVGPLAAKRCGVKKIVIHSHATGYDAQNPYKRAVFTLLHKICRMFLYTFGTDFYACSKNAGLWMFPEKIVNSNQFQVVLNAIDTDLFAYNPETRTQLRTELQLEDSFVIGHIGNFLYPKNHSFLLHAFAKVHQKDPSSHLLLIGDGPLLDSVRMQTKELGVEDAVLFVGRRTDANLYLQAMDVFAFPSVFEGLGMVAIEAQAAGLPCICSDRIPPEAKATDLCSFLPIDTQTAAEDWANALLQAKNTLRKNRKAEISAAGYDINAQDFKNLV
ncbi:MAG: glycosyltransferase [Candidatus Fimenecus sp.]